MVCKCPCDRKNITLFLRFVLLFCNFCSCMYRMTRPWAGRAIHLSKSVPLVLASSFTVRQILVLPSSFPPPQNWSKTCISPQQPYNIILPMNYVGITFSHNTWQKNSTCPECFGRKFFKKNTVWGLQKHDQIKNATHLAFRLAFLQLLLVYLQNDASMNRTCNTSFKISPSSTCFFIYFLPPWQNFSKTCISPQQNQVKIRREKCTYISSMRGVDDKYTGAMQCSAN